MKGTIPMRWTSLIVVSTLSLFVDLGAAFGQSLPDQHLLPESDPFGTDQFTSDYNRLLRKHFVAQKPQLAQVIIAPSNEREESISIQEIAAGSTRVVHCVANRSIWIEYAKAVGIWGREMHPNASRHGSNEEISVSTACHDAPLSADLEIRLIRSWISFLRMTHYGPFTSYGDDGTMYHFTATVYRRGVVAGWTWSPPPTSLAGRFIELSTRLAEYADATEGGRPKVQAKIEVALSEVERELGL